MPPERRFFYACHFFYNFLFLTLDQIIYYKSNHMSITKEFKEFAMRGNVIDLAVGVIIGASFGKIVIPGR